MAASSTRLVGRDTELSMLGDAVARARDGHHTTVLVEADAGLGKTRLLTETLATYADPKDATALSAGYELAGGKLPWGTATELLRTLVRSAGVAKVRDAAGAYVPDLAPLCPGLDGTGGAQGDIRSAVDRARLLPAVATTVENLAADRLVWLAVEDLHWVDAHTLDLLTYLLRLGSAGSLLTLLTLRTHDPATPAAVTDLAAAITGQPPTLRLTLPPLSTDAATDLVTGLAEPGTPAPIVDRIVTLAQGSPLLAEQLLAAGTHGPAHIADTDPLPEAAAQPMLARFRRLDPRARRAAQVASLGEGHLSRHLLTQASVVALRPGPGHPGPADIERAADAVDAATTAGLLRYRPADRTFTFSHALLRMAVESTLSPSDRDRIHRRWAGLLTDSTNHGYDPQLQIAAAHHWAATDQVVETFTSALEAATVTGRLGATGETADLLLRACGLWDRIPDPEGLSGRSRDDVVFDALNLLEAGGRFHDALTLLDRELAHTAPTGHDRLRHLCLRMAREDEYDSLGEDIDEAPFLEAAQDADLLLSAAPSRVSLVSLLYVGWFLRWKDSELSLRLHERAFAHSAHLGHADHSWVTITMSLQLSDRGLTDEALAVCDQGLAVASSLIERWRIQSNRGWVLFQGGRFAESAVQVERALAWIPDPALMRDEWAYLAPMAVQAHHALGDWAQARDLLARCTDLEPTGWESAVSLAAEAALADVARGDLAAAGDRADWARQHLPAHSLIPSPATLATWVACAEVAAAARRYADALSVLEPALRQPGPSAFAGLWRPVLTAARIAADHAATGGQPDQTLVGLTVVAVATLPRTGPLNAACHLHASADLDRARDADAAEVWEAVVASWRSLGHLPFLAAALLRLADARHRAADTAGVADPLAEAWQIATALGATPLRDAVTEAARRARVSLAVGSKETPARVGSLARLTERELEVLRHVALGESNDEIGAALFISPKTASVHVSRILTKLDAPNRAKATAIAYEQGLFGPG